MARSVIKVGTSASSLVEVPTPDGLSWGLQDISAADSGRVNDAGNTMYKMRTSQKRKLQLSWSNPDQESCAAILQAFNPEYVFVSYPDALSGTYEVREFYVGDRSAPLRQIVLGTTVYTSLSFDIIER